jgi:hypothetical protein
MMIISNPLFYTTREKNMTLDMFYRILKTYSFRAAPLRKENEQGIWSKTLTYEGQGCLFVLDKNKSICYKATD